MRTRAYSLHGHRQVLTLTPEMIVHLLGLVDKMIRLIPVGKEIGRLLVVHSDIVIGKQPREEVIDFPRHV